MIRLLDSLPDFPPVGLLAAGAVFLCSCNNGPIDRGPTSAPERIANFEHLDHLGETVGSHDPARIVHIYSEAPGYAWVGDEDEGIACVDDAARAAVVYLRDFELNGSSQHRQTAEELMRFLLAMQDESGLFYNFIWDNDLTINKTHNNSKAERVEWWTARAVWALGVGARVLKTVNPSMSAEAHDAVIRTYPHLRELLRNYGITRTVNDRRVPTWLIYETASDATSELLLGLIALYRAYPDEELSDFIDKFADGIASMQWGSMNRFPWTAHGSWIDAWHGWGNSQTQALAQLGHRESAVAEAENFYPRLLIEGWMHSFALDNPDSIRRFEQIAYAVRCVAVGLIRLYEATGDERYATMAGLAASWFTGHNVADAVMYDPSTGRGYDGINDSVGVNRNAGAESTIEALFTMIEVERIPIAKRWMYATSGPRQSAVHAGKQYVYRVFTTGSMESEIRVALAMNLTDEKLELLFGPELAQFLVELS